MFFGNLTAFQVQHKVQAFPLCDGDSPHETRMLPGEQIGVIQQLSGQSRVLPMGQDTMLYFSILFAALLQ